MMLTTKVRCAVFALGGVMLWAGCGDTTNTAPVMVKPDVPPEVQGKDSMNAYLKDHPKAAKDAGKGVAP